MVLREWIFEIRNVSKFFNINETNKIVVIMKKILLKSIDHTGRIIII